MRRKLIYLTIDDGPSSFMHLKVDELLKERVPAIWYCRGEFMERRLEQVVYAISRGFLIGNHSYSHPRFSTISLKEAEQEILETEHWIELAYRQAKVPRRYRLFRFPFMDKGSSQSAHHKDQLQKLLLSLSFQRAGFESVTYGYFQGQFLDKDIDAPWTFDAKEYAIFQESLMEKHGLYKISDFLNRMMQNDPENGLGLTDASSNDIVLFHDFEQTHALFSPMLQQLIAFPVLFQLPLFDLPDLQRN